MKVEPNYDAVTRKAGFIIGCLAFLLSILIGYFWDYDKAWPAGLATGLLIVVVMFYWQFRKAIWFWLAVGMVMVIHFTLIAILPVRDPHYAAPLLLALALLDIWLSSLFVKMIGLIAHRFDLGGEVKNS